MRLLHLTHPDQADLLPAAFSDWALAFDATERRAQQQQEGAG